MERPVKIKERLPAWLGLDSLNGNFVFGSPGTPEGGLVPSNSAISIMTRSNALFKAERLYVKRDCASNFLIRTVFVGCQYGYHSVNHQNPLIAEPFAVNFDDLPKLDFEMFDGKTAVKIAVDRNFKDLLGAPFPLPTLQPGLDLTFQIENVGDYDQRFLGALIGTAVW